jgi:hypothetical protein
MLPLAFSFFFLPFAMFCSFDATTHSPTNQRQPVMSVEEERKQMVKWSEGWMLLLCFVLALSTHNNDLLVFLVQSFEVTYKE